MSETESVIAALRSKMEACSSRKATCIAASRALAVACAGRDAEALASRAEYRAEIAELDQAERDLLEAIDQSEKMLGDERAHARMERAKDALADCHSLRAEIAYAASKLDEMLDQIAAACGHLQELGAKLQAAAWCAGLQAGPSHLDQPIVEILYGKRGFMVRNRIAPARIETTSYPPVRSVAHVTRAWAAAIPIEQTDKKAS